MMFRIGARTVAAAGAVAVVGVLAAPALAATTVSQATAQSLKLSIAGTPAVTQIVTATNDGTTQTKNNASTLPTLAQVLPTNNALGLGVAPQDAGANANGTSFACAGIAGTGGGIVHTGNSACAINGAPITLGLGDLKLGTTVIDPTSAIGGALSPLTGTNGVTALILAPIEKNLLSAITNALKGTPLDIKLGGTLSAIEGVCQATPTSATGSAHLVDTHGGSKPTPITATIGGQTLTLLNLPANPPPNTNLLTNLNTVTQTVINAVKTELSTAIQGQLQPLSALVGTQVLQTVQDQLINTLVAQLQPVLQPLKANVLNVTLNKQVFSDGGKKIDVTALDLQVLPAAAQFAKASLIGGQLGHVTCGPNTKPGNNNGGGNNGGGNNGGGTPGHPTVIPHGVDAGLVGDSSNLALTAALSGTALAAAAALGLYYRRLASQ